MYPEQKIRIVSGFSKQKDVSAILHFLQRHPSVESVNIVTSPHFKLQSHEDLMEKIKLLEKVSYSFERINPIVDL